MTKQECKDRLEYFKKLKKNWDSYKAQPVSKIAIERAKDFCEYLIDNGIDNFLLFPTHSYDLPSSVSIQMEQGDSIADITIFEYAVSIYTQHPDRSSIDSFDDYNKEVILDTFKKKFLLRE